MRLRIEICFVSAAYGIQRHEGQTFAATQYKYSLAGTGATQYKYSLAGTG